MKDFLVSRYGSFVFSCVFFKGDLELFPGDECVTGLRTRTYGAFTLTVTAFTATFTPTGHARLQPKPRISHKQKPWHLQKGFDSFMLKVQNTWDVFFSSILLVAVSHTFLSPKQEFGRDRYIWLVASNIQYQLVLRRFWLTDSNWSGPSKLPDTSSSP